MEHAITYARIKSGAGYFTPYSIRHAVSERIVAEMGDAAEQAYLSHGGDRMTRRYSGFDSTLAARVALQMG